MLGLAVSPDNSSPIMAFQQEPGHRLLGQYDPISDCCPVRCKQGRRNAIASEQAIKISMFGLPLYSISVKLAPLYCRKQCKGT